MKMKHFVTYDLEEAVRKALVWVTGSNNVYGIYRFGFGKFLVCRPGLPGTNWRKQVMVVTPIETIKLEAGQPV